MSSSQPTFIEPDEIDDLPPYNPSSSTAVPPLSASPQPQVFGRIGNIGGEIVSDRRYTGGDTLDEPVSATLVRPLSLIGLYWMLTVGIVT
jgi:hypothetical protein